VKTIGVTGARSVLSMRKALQEQAEKRMQKLLEKGETIMKTRVPGLWKRLLARKPEMEADDSIPSADKLNIIDPPEDMHARAGNLDRRVAFPGYTFLKRLLSKKQFT
jgi:hypothetical protein